MHELIFNGTSFICDLYIGIRGKVRGPVVKTLLQEMRGLHLTHFLIFNVVSPEHWSNPGFHCLQQNGNGPITPYLSSLLRQLLTLYSCIFRTIPDFCSVQIGNGDLPNDQ